jgi:hypothetical protein
MVGISIYGSLRGVARFPVSYVTDRSYGGLREKIFLLPFWEKRCFGAKTPPKYTKFLTLSP